MRERRKGGNGLGEGYKRSDQPWEFKENNETDSVGAPSSFRYTVCK